MRWAVLFLILATITVIAYVIRGAMNFDGLALLTVVFLILAGIAGWLWSWASRRELDRKYHR